MDNIKFEDFEKIDIRIGTVVHADIPAWSHWVVRLEAEFGPAFAKATVGKRRLTCFSGISKFFKPEDLVDKQFPFVVNLEPKKIGPDKELSEAMMIMVDPGEGDNDVRPILFNLQEKVPDGTKVR